MKLRFILTLAIALFGLATVPAAAQTTAADGTVYVEPLFKYPEAPPFIENLGDRSDFLMDNFWKEMNFKQKVVNQAALQHAFEVYSAPMRWAQKGKVISSVKALLKKLEKNPTLATQFMKAAEETFHSPRSMVYIDEVYTMMLEGFIHNKKVPKARKERYIKQLAAIRNTELGKKMPEVAAVDTAGNAVTPRIGTEYTFVIFGSHHDSDTRRQMLQMNTNMAMERLCESGELAMNFFNTARPDAETASFLATLPSFFVVASAPKAASEVDIRIAPSVYLLDNQGVILAKNVTVEEAFAEIANRKFNTQQQQQQQ